MITKEDAMIMPHGTTLYHTSIKGSDKRPVRCRVTGKCKTWKTKPEKFRLPVKHGMRQSFYIENVNAGDWRKEEYEVT
jgi:hypothetical protein